MGAEASFAHAPVVVDLAGLDALIGELAGEGHRVLGPVARHGAITLAPLRGVADLPAGFHDEQAPGHYALHHEDDGELFGWAVGPESPKRALYPPSETLFRAHRRDGTVVFEEVAADEAPLAFVGLRPCELAATAVLDRVLAQGRYGDGGYTRRREGAVVVVAECNRPSGSCFCTSMGTGPGATDGFDLALSELPGRGELVVRAGSTRGAELLGRIPSRPAGAADLEARAALLEAAAARVTRHLDTDGLAERLAASADDPAWDAVAERCLACGNCTMVCPTCFCSDLDDTTDLGGATQRRRRWASCFELGHSYLHGGAVRSSIASRYRQWATHKLSTWHDQFGTSGCVGCGRCITWCPVAIDLTEEAAAVGARTATPGPGEPTIQGGRP